jgi:hypothetical protein
VLHISPTFGAIHLEDIATPLCYEVEERLIEALDKPVMHDDQHGTAVVALAAHQRFAMADPSISGPFGSAGWDRRRGPRDREDGDGPRAVPSSART